MRFLLDRNEKGRARVFETTGGIRCDEVVFNAEDIARLVGDPEQAVEYLRMSVLPRFIPPNANH